MRQSNLLLALLVVNIVLTVLALLCAFYSAWHWYGVEQGLQEFANSFSSPGGGIGCALTPDGC